MKSFPVKSQITVYTNPDYSNKSVCVCLCVCCSANWTLAFSSHARATFSSNLFQIDSERTLKIYIYKHDNSTLYSVCFEIFAYFCCSWFFSDPEKYLRIQRLRVVNVNWMCDWQWSPIFLGYIQNALLFTTNILKF